MDDFSLFEIKGKDIFVTVAVVLVLFGICFYAGYCIGWERAEDVYCNGTGTEPVGQQLGEAGTNISNAETGIDNASQHIATGTESVDYLQGTVSTSAELIKQCQQIIARIRQRGETHPSAN